MSIRWIDEHEDWAGKTVLVRAELNVPVENGVVIDDFRIKRAIPTLAYLKEKDAKIIIISHIGREPDETLASVAEELKKHIPVAFIPRSDLGMKAAELRNGEILLVENLRQDPREVLNDETFAQELAQLADVFVQDAFATCHREHASFVGIPKFLPSFGGLLLKEEVTNLTAALTPEHPSLAILGGAKFETKEPLIRKFLDMYDKVFVGGALANEIIAAKGFGVGHSRVEDKKIASDIIEHPNLLPVVDIVAADEDENKRVTSIDTVREDEAIVDIGPATMESVAKVARAARTIVWNGPMGWYERGYTQASNTLADAIEESGKDENNVCRTHTVIGGGDTLAIVDERVHDACTFVSTGGGAMLEFLLKGTLPGIEALKHASRVR
jgi:phosphoglycerate kinase